MQIIGEGRLLVDGTFESAENATGWNVSGKLERGLGAYVERWNRFAYATLSVDRSNRDEVLERLFGVR